MRKALVLIILLTIFIHMSCRQPSKDADNQQVFRYNQAEQLRSLDPAFASNQPNIWAVTQLYNGLVEFDADLHVIPALAKSWEITDSGRVYTFYLRNDARFHDHKLFPNGKGRTFNARDVEYSFKRVVDTNDIYNSGMWIFKDKVLKTSKGTLSDTCFKAKDDTTFKIYLQQACPHFLEILCMPYALIVPEDLAAKLGQDFRKDPVGTGPFQFNLWDEGNALILEKNKHYWRKDKDGHDLPYIDAVQLSFITDKNQAFRSFMLKNFDFVSGVEEGTIDEILYRDGTFKEKINEDFDAYKKPYLNTEYLVIQCDPEAPVYKGKDHPLLNKYFRRALNYAIDRKRFIINLRNGVGTPGIAGIVPPAVPDYDISTMVGYDISTDSALVNFDRSGWRGKEIPELVLTVSKEHRAWAEFLQKQWSENLALKVSIDINESGTNRDLARKGEINLFRASWLGDYPDAENYLSLFYGPNFTPNGPNKCHYQNEQFDSLYQVAMREPLREKRYKLFHQMDQIMINDAPVLVLFYDEVVRINQQYVRGFEPDAMNLVKLEKVKLLKEER